MITNIKANIKDLITFELELPSTNTGKAILTPGFIESEQKHSRITNPSKESCIRENIVNIVLNLSKTGRFYSQYVKEIIDNGTVVYIGALYSVVKQGKHYLNWSVTNNDGNIISFFLPQYELIDSLVKDSNLIFLDYYNSFYSQFYFQRTSFITRKDNHSPNNQLKREYFINLSHELFSQISPEKAEKRLIEF